MLIAGGYQARLTGQMAKIEDEIADRLGQLSTGARIQKAADDPAGLAIATGLRVRVRSREMAIRNTEDGLAMADLADAGLYTTASLLSRMRELAVQSASETLSDTERVYVQDEFAVLLDEIDRHAQTVLYNGETVISPPGVDVGLLIDASGSMGGEKAKVTSQIQSFIDQFVAARYNVRVGAVAYAMTQDGVDNVNLLAQLGDSDITGAISALSLGLGPVDPYAAMTEVTGITRTSGTAETDRLAFRQSAVKMLVLVSDAKRSANVNGMVESEVAAALAEQDYQLHAITPASVLFDYDDIVSETGGDSYSIGDASGSGIPAALDAIATAAIDALDNSETKTIHTGPDATDLLSTPFPLDASSLGLDIADLSVETVAEARAAISSLSAATQTLGGLRGQVGATQSRLEHTLSRNVSALEAEVAAEGRISDQSHAVAATALAAAQLRQQGIIGAAAIARKLSREQAERLLS